MIDSIEIPGLTWALGSINTVSGNWLAGKKSFLLDLMRAGSMGDCGWTYDVAREVGANLGVLNGPDEFLAFLNAVGEAELLTEFDDGLRFDDLERLCKVSVEAARVSGIQFFITSNGDAISNLWRGCEDAGMIMTHLRLNDSYKSVNHMPYQPKLFDHDIIGRLLDSGLCFW